MCGAAPVLTVCCCLGCCTECGGIGESATLGLHTRRVAPDEASEFEDVEHIPIKQRVIHPCNDPATFDYDFMIVELQWSTQKFQDHVMVVDGEDGGVDLSNEPLTGMGFGSLFFYPARPPEPITLQNVTMEYDPSCEGHDSADITESMLCAGDGGARACQVGTFACNYLRFIFIS